MTSVLWNKVFDGQNGEPADATYFTPVLGDGSQYNLQGWGTNDFEIYTRTATLQDGNGNLVITTKQNTDASIKTNNQSSYGPYLPLNQASFTSGKIVTKDKLEFLYGTIEAEIQFPVGNNNNFAWWMLSSQYPNLTWPYSGEIDIIELFGFYPNRLYSTVHSNGAPTGDYNYAEYHLPPNYDYKNTSDVSDFIQGGFNKYIINWDPIGMTFVVNSTTILTISKVTDYTAKGFDYPFDRPFYLIYQNAINGTNGGGETPVQSQSFMKYIKYSTYNGFGSLTCQTNQLGSPWSHLRGMYSTNTALSPYHGPTTTPLPSWQYLANNSIFSSASIDASGNIYFGCEDGYLYSLFSTGELRWKTLIDASGLIRTAPCIGPTGNVYAGSLQLNNDYSVNVNYPGKIACISTDGDVIATSTWASSIFSSPILGISGTNGGQGSLIITTCDGYLRALNPTTLEQRWFSQINTPYQMNTGVIFSSPTIGSDGTIYIGSYNKNIYAFPPSPVNQILTSTSPLWTYQCESSIYTTPAINNNILYVSDNNGNLYAFQTVTSNIATAGQLLWKFVPLFPYSTNITPVLSFGSPAFGPDGTIYYTVYTNDNETIGTYLFAVNPKQKSGGSFTPNFKIPSGGIGQTQGMPFVGADGTIYINSVDGVIYGFRYNETEQSFTILFTYSVSGNAIYGTTSLSMDSKGVLYIGGLNSKMTALAPQVVPPDAPEITSIIPGNQQLTVNFIPPFYNGGSSITGYQYSIDSGSTFSSTVQATNNSLLITGLTNGTPYSVIIRAGNSAGFGDSSKLSYGTPLPVPSAPTINSIIPGNQQLTVNFTPPTNDGGSSIEGYQYSINNGTFSSTVQATNNSLLITGLTNGTPYSVIIRAVNFINFGANSNLGYGTPIASSTVFTFDIICYSYQTWETTPFPKPSFIIKK